MYIIWGIYTCIRALYITVYYRLRAYSGANVYTIFINKRALLQPLWTWWLTVSWRSSQPWEPVLASVSPSDHGDVSVLPCESSLLPPFSDGMLSSLVLQLSAWTHFAESPDSDPLVEVSGASISVDTQKKQSHKSVRRFQELHNLIVEQIFSSNL